MVILLTGGTGYIGSHTGIACLEKGHEIILFDNLSNSTASVVEQMGKITQQPITFVQGNVLDTGLLYDTLIKYQVDAVIHFAGLKSVKDSTQFPLEYYENNFSGTISLLKAMNRANIHNIVFSSSATVYGDPQYLPYDESHPTSPINVYGHTKLQVEQALQDLASADLSWKILSLRYFNPVGAHSSGLIGENPLGVPNNLMPFIAKVASGELPFLNIFGNDYDTKDGTGERDYIHVMDLAEAHIAAIHYINQHQGYLCLNIGTGNSYSVFDLLKAFEKVIGKEIPFQIAPRRSGDLPRYFADPSLAKKILHWSTKRTLKEMCHSTWKYKSQVMDNES